MENFMVTDDILNKLQWKTKDSCQGWSGSGGKSESAGQNLSVGKKMILCQFIVIFRYAKPYVIWKAMIGGYRINLIFATRLRYLVTWPSKIRKLHIFGIFWGFISYYNIYYTHTT